MITPRPVFPNIDMFAASTFLGNGYQSTLTSPIPFFTSPLTTPRGTPIPGTRLNCEDYGSLVQSVLAANSNNCKYLFTNFIFWKLIFIFKLEIIY